MSYCLFDDVQRFQQLFGIEPGEDTFHHYVEHIKEEMKELEDATTPEDLLDALMDLICVTIGATVALQCDGQGAWNEVQRANFDKLRGRIQPLERIPGGKIKIQKPEGWAGPRLTKHLGPVIKDLSRFKEGQ